MTDGNRIVLNLTGTLVALLIVSMFGGSIFALLKIDIPQANQNVLLVLLGALTSQVTSIVQWFFGSSAGDKAKNDTIASLSQTNQTVTNAAIPTPPTINIPAGAQATVAATPNGGNGTP